MNICALGYVGVGSQRAAEWDTFGPDILGTPVSAQNDGTRLVRWDDRVYRLAIHTSNRDQLLYVGWEVPGPGALDEAIESLNRAKITATPGTDAECRTRQVEALVRFQDPWGLTHELFYGQRTLLSFRPTRDIAGFITRDMGMGHIVLALPDLKMAVNFFVNVMGFRVSDFIDHPFPLGFFHCNPRHHSLAVGQAGPVRGLHHIMIETQNLKDLGSTYALCKERNIPLAMDLGQHTNDQMLSFYIRTPSGFELEYGWGGLLIEDEETWRIDRIELPSFWGHDTKLNTPPTTMEPVTDSGAI